MVATTAIVEKGYIDVRLSVASPGGHSSIPPKHTVRALSSHIRLLVTCHPEYWIFGCSHRRDRSQSNRPQALPRYAHCPEFCDPYNPPCPDNVFYDTLLCIAVHSTEIDSDVKKAILASIKSDKALKALESIIFKIPLISALVGTTRAVDIVGGGVKA